MQSGSAMEGEPMQGLLNSTKHGRDTMTRIATLTLCILAGLGAWTPRALAASAEADTTAASAARSFSAVGGTHQTLTLGSTDKATGFKFQIELDSKGAALARATLSEHPDLSDKAHPPLLLVEPARTGDLPVLSVANRQLVLVDAGQQLDLDRLEWVSAGVQADANNAQTARFEATVVDGNDRPLFRLIKTYTLSPDSYLVDVNLAVENLSGSRESMALQMTGPAGIRRESMLADMPKAVAAFRETQGGQVASHKLDALTLSKARDASARLLRIKDSQAPLLWSGISNKYFAAILVPVPEPNRPACDWIRTPSGLFFNPDGDPRKDSGDETVAVEFQTAPVTLAAAGEPGASRTYAFQLYLGPKDKGLFDKNTLFRGLGFVHVIDFAGCCCPSSIINPLAFLILALMKAMYTVLFNYGLVIIVLVLLMRLVMHPVTKSSQVAMHKMSKLAPKAEEIKKKYANNKTEMNRELMALYRDQGASPIMGFLPMLIQMPVWIALWTAVNSSIDLRGQAFLPVWITDLAAPDALIRFPKVFVLPWLGWKIAGVNLLPILMGVAFYLQQKFTPTQAAAASNPQMAQQQKMMMWMMPIMFPLMLYNTASGVNLYIMTSTFAGVWEQKIILKHIKAREQAEAQGLVAVTSKTGGKVKKKKAKPFFKF